MQNTYYKFALVASFLLFTPVVAANESEPRPDLHQLKRRADATLAAKQTKPASWTVVQEMGAAKIEVKAVEAPGMQRYTVSALKDDKSLKLTDIIVRDGAWYVLDDKRACKCRPYEAPMDIPLVYLALGRSSPQVVDSDFLVSKGTLESIGSDVVTYRIPLDDATRRQLATAMAQLDEMDRRAEKEGASKPVPRDVQQTRQLLHDLVFKGTPIKVDLQTGLISQCGVIGKRIWLRDFRLLQQIGTTQFDVSDRDWQDKTSPMKVDDPADLVMIKHSGIWRPGQPASDLEARILNVKTGDCRRVPYQGPLCSPICFSPDRKRVYVGGVVFGNPGMSLIEIDLETLKHRRLGLPLLDRGFVLFGAMSPDGKTLVVPQAGVSERAVDQQLVPVDVASGKAKPLGSPLDCAPPSWLPDGSGVVLISRKSQGIGQVSEGFVSRMDLEGHLTPLLPGDCATSLAPKSAILFQRREDVWMTCDLEGKGTQQALDGLSKFGFPAPSPDGNRVLMMKFGGTNGPVPYVVDFKIGRMTPVSVASGFWAFPVWR